MSKKIDKKLLIGLGVVLILLGVVVIAKFYIIPNNNSTLGTAKEFITASENFDYALDSTTYKAEDITVISNFEKEESNIWQGNGIFDEKVFYEGSRSISLISSDRKAASINLIKTLDLTSMKQIEFMLNVTDIDAFETATLDFGDLAFGSYFRYNFSNLKNGWNLIQIPKEQFVLYKAKDATFDWLNIEKIRFTILSRTASNFIVRMDMLRSNNYPENYQNQWRASTPGMFLSLYDKAGSIKLLARNIGTSVATIKDIEDTNDFDFSASLSPQSSGRSGLFVRGDYVKGYGYYLLLGGDKKNTWQILKKNVKGWTPTAEIVQGSLDNVVFSKDKDYWLRVIGNGNILKFYYSSDGQQYEKLGQLNDGEFRGGGLGIAVLDSSWSLFDNLKFKKL